MYGEGAPVAASFTYPLEATMQPRMLRQLAKEFNRMADSLEQSRRISKAAEYERTARQVSDPVLRRGYEELAKQTRAGAPA